MNKALITKIVLNILIFLGLGIGLRAYFGAAVFTTDISGISVLVSFLGTIYTLVAAFTIVEVWGQFNTVSNLFSKEAKAITSIWNYVDYLNDAQLDKSMKTALTNYILATIKHEHTEAAGGVRSVHPSKQLLEIFHTLDKITFNDKRDATIFPLIVAAYEDLSSIRSERIDASVTRLPSMLRFFFNTLTLFLMVGVSLIGFNAVSLYVLSIFSASFVTSITYQIIFDLDNPFDGEWNISYEPFEEAQKYIDTNKHSV
jgi:hypothetical protein